MNLKKLIGCIFLIGFANCISAQLLRNGGFEEVYKDNWGNVLPKYWEVNFRGMTLDTTAPTKPYKGLYSQVLFNIIEAGSTYEASVGILRNKLKLDCIPTKFSAFINYFPNYPNEKFLITAILFNRNGDGIDTIATGMIEPLKSEKISKWTKFEGNIEYRKQVVPDSAIITIYNSQSSVYHKNTTLVIDEVNFSDTLSSLSVADVTPAPINKISVFPNPASNQLTIKVTSPEKETYTLKIFDILGRELVTTQLPIDSNNEIKVNTENLQNGPYFLSVFYSNMERIETSRFVIFK